MQPDLVRQLSTHFVPLSQHLARATSCITLHAICARLIAHLTRTAVSALLGKLHHVQQRSVFHVLALRVFTPIGVRTDVAALVSRTQEVSQSKQGFQTGTHDRLLHVMQVLFWRHAVRLRKLSSVRTSAHLRLRTIQSHRLHCLSLERQASTTALGRDTPRINGLTVTRPIRWFLLQQATLEV